MPGISFYGSGNALERVLAATELTIPTPGNRPEPEYLLDLTCQTSF
jgi:hypothetical protein